ncbi:MAG: pantetheine-phosphate adenylyltransferase [Lachnospiraceae bacterium]|nr:pantetheine-phosphate adenylyltransferase [Lachnospiraceae bacterium]
MRKAIYPGSFDPVTYGHVDIIRRASALVDELVIGVLKNNAKKGMFSVEERIDFLKRVTADIPNVRIISFDGLLVDCAVEYGTRTIIRGLRAVTDFEYELQLAQTNKRLRPDIDTVFLTTNVEYAYLSSSVVREIAGYGGDISHFVPECIIEDVYKKAKRGEAV